MKYIDAEKLKAEIEKRIAKEELYLKVDNTNNPERKIWIQRDKDLFNIIRSLQQEQPAMIQWTGNNLKEVIDFTGKSPRFEEWFKSWEEFETYVHQHNDILKLFCEDGGHYEVPVGAWIVKTPDGYNVPSVSRFVQKQPECLEKTARISPGMLSNFGTSTYVLDVDLTQDEMAKVAPVGLNSGEIKIKLVCE